MKKLFNLLLFSILVAVDQLTKYLVVSQGVSYDNGLFFAVRLSYNRGISWGMFHSESSLTFALVSVVIACTLIYFAWYTFCVYRAEESIVAYTVVCAGAVSNFIDRLSHGAVIDFILFYWRELHFPIFNPADVFIVCGVFYILFFQSRD